MNGSKHLILGFCARKKFSELAPFIASLRHTTFAGDVCIVVEDVVAETVEQLRAHGIVVERSARSAQPRMTAMSSRYFSFLDFLTRHSGDYARVMLADPAAVIYQSDPFAVQLPADIVYTADDRRIGELRPVYDAVVQAYGEAVAKNIRNCVVADASATIGTCSGMQRYLVAMTRELGGRSTPVTGTVDCGVHNYVVHMRPLQAASLDQANSVVTAFPTTVDRKVDCTEQDVLVDGRRVPVLSHWGEQPSVLEHVRSAARFRLSQSMRCPWPTSVNRYTSANADVSTDVVLAFYQRQRDATWLRLFLGSLRCVSGPVSIHCVGNFDQNELTILSRYGCTVHHIATTEPDIAENIAHFYLSRLLDSLASETHQYGQVLVLDNMRAIFPRDPFQAKTIGLSLFCEGAFSIGESAYNRDRLAFFTPLTDELLQRPVVSSQLLRGSVPVVRELYRQLFTELVGRSELLATQKVVQGAFNKLCYGRSFAFPVIAHPSGAEAFFDFLPSDLAVDTKHGVRVGGSVPAVVLGGHPESALMMKLRVDLGLAEV